MIDEDGDCLFTTGGCCLVFFGIVAFMTNIGYAIFKILT